MLIRRTHRLLELLLIVFIVYLLLTRAFISWVQYAPEHFSSTVKQWFSVDINYQQLEVEQNWLGFQLEAQQVSVQADSFTFSTASIAADVNFFSFIIPTLVYGDYLRLQNAVIEHAGLQTSDQPALEFRRDDIQQQLLIPESVRSLWNHISIRDLRVLVNNTEPLGVHLKRLDLVKSGQISLVAEFGLKYRKALDYETFSLVLNASENRLGGVGDGSLNIISYRPVKVEGLVSLLPEKWQEILPAGEVLVEAEAIFKNSKLSKVVTRLNGQSLVWPQNDASLPNSAGAELEWLIESNHLFTGQNDWHISLLKLQLDNRYLDQISPIELKVDDDFLQFSAKSLDIEPFKVITQALIIDPEIASLFGKTAHLAIQNLQGFLNWRTLELPQLHFYLKKLAIPVTQFPSMAIENLSFDKEGEKLFIQVPKPAWLVDTRIHPDAVRLMFDDTIQIDLDEQGDFQLAPFELMLDKIRYSVSQLSVEQGILKVDSRLALEQGGEILDYLPYPWMSQPLTKWLAQSSIIAGKTYADFKISAPLERFLATGEGVTLEGVVRDAQLQYDPKWPMLKNLSVEFSMQNYVLALSAKRALLDEGLEVEQVQVEIGNLLEKNIAVDISGQLNTPLPTALSFIQKTPLIKSESFTQFLQQDVSLQGNADVNINQIWIPVSGYQDRVEEVDITLGLKDAELALFDRLHFDRLQGEVRIQEDSVRSKGLVAGFLDGPVAIELSGSKNRLDVAFNGEAVDISEQFFQNPIPWKFRLVVPYAKKPLTYDGRVDFSTAKSLLPAPLDSMSLAAPLTLSGSFDEQLQVGLESVLLGKVALNIDYRQAPYPIEGEVFWGKKSEEPAKWSEVGNASLDGVTVNGGLGSLDVGKWMELLNKEELSFLKSSAGNKYALNWRNPRLMVNKMQFNSYEFPNSQVTWYKRANGDLNYRVIGPKLDVAVVEDTAGKLDVQVGNMLLATKEGQQEASNNLVCHSGRQSFAVPQIKFAAKKIQMNDYVLNNLTFNVYPHPQGFFANNIQGELGKAFAKVEGAYSFNNNTDESSLVLFLKSDKLKQLTNYLGINKGFDGKDARANLRVTWQGAVDCFNTVNLKGPVDFSAKDGVIEDVEPGIARLLGLLSVDSIVRRLQLNLKDITNKGFVYDEIKANAVLKQNAMRLESLKVIAPSAQVSMKGDVNIEAMTFDLSAKVTPALGSTLPTVAAIAGVANPLAAIAVYTLMKVLPDVNEELVTFDYRITGPWKEPKLELVNN